MPELQSLAPLYPAVGPQLGSVALFTGCISEHFDQQTLLAAIKVLTRLGYQVHVPRQQACCGAIHYHNGDQHTAEQLMQQNRSCFNDLEVDAVVYCATGCGAQLQDYTRILNLEAEAFDAELHEICDFVNSHWHDEVKLKPSNQTIAVHEACSQRNVLKNEQAMYQMLARIPELTVHSLADNHQCCGAGGSYMLTHPDNAQALREMKWQYIEHSQADCLVSANIGCALHLQSGQPQANQIQIKHPVTLLAELLAV